MHRSRVKTKKLRLTVKVTGVCTVSMGVPTPRAIAIVTESCVLYNTTITVKTTDQTSRCLRPLVRCPTASKVYVNYRTIPVITVG